MGIDEAIRRFDVFLIDLHPTRGSEIRKTRPCLVISPDEMNAHVRTVIIAPMTTKGSDFPTRVSCMFQSVRGQIVLDQLRTVDRARLAKRLGTVGKKSRQRVLDGLAELFSA